MLLLPLSPVYDTRFVYWESIWLIFKTKLDYINTILTLKFLDIKYYTKKYYEMQFLSSQYDEKKPLNYWSNFT